MSEYSAPKPKLQIKKSWGYYFSLALTAFRESFVALVPYVIVSSLAILIGQALKNSRFESGIFDVDNIDILINAPAQYFPLALLVSLSFHGAKRFKSSPLISILLSIVILFSLDSILVKSHGDALFIYPEPSLLIISIPITTIGLLKFFAFQWPSKLYGKTRREIRETHELILPFTIVYLISIVFYGSVHILIKNYSVLVVDLSSLNQNLNYTIRIFLGQLLWFFGIHGTNSVNAVIGADIYSDFIFDGLTYKQFHDLFIVCGGSGSGLSLLIAILLFSNDKQSLNIAKLAFPFVIFNINEILLFGLPVVLNRVLLTPFLLVPIFNIAIAYLCFPLLSHSTTVQSPPWTTPIFLNAYLMFKGNIYVVVLQAFFLVTGVVIYRPYIKRLSRLKNPNYYLQKMKRNLGLLESFKAAEGIRFHQKQTSIIRASFKLDEIIELLHKNSLTVYYQPKIDVKNNTCHQFEALLRLKTVSGRVMGPYFLEDIENAGMATIIDLWVCQTVSQDLKTWEKYGLSPEIGINLHPDTLGNRNTLEKISLALLGQEIEFEIIERSLIEFSDCKSGVLYLRSQGFKIALDDFGAGYSNLITLSELPIHTVKLDRSIISQIEQPSGYKVVKHISALCTDLKFNCVAEGIETEQQLQLLQKMGVRYCQGYYFAKAVPLEAAIMYKLEAMN